MKALKKILSMVIVFTMITSLFAGCSSNKDDQGDAMFKKGTYTAEVDGHNGKLKVQVIVDNSKIKEIKVLEHKETQGISDPAIENIPKAIIDGQTLTVDTVAGATVTSKAILKAVEEALKQAGADIEKLKQDKEDTALEKGETENTDIVIVGAGMAGVMAAVELRNNYPDVKFVLLERLPAIGGSLVTTGGAIFGVDSKLHQKENKKTDVKDIINHFKQNSKGDINEELVTEAFKLSGETINILSDMGVRFNDKLDATSPFAPTLFAARAVEKGVSFHKDLNKAVHDLKMDLRLESTASELIVENGEVKGVLVQDKKKEYKIMAKKVILATGGFGSNEELMKKYAPEYANGVIATPAGAKGDTFKFTEQFGTPVLGEGTMGTIVNEDKSALFPNTFMVNKDGKRFCNETDALYIRQRAVIEKAGGSAFVIGDKNTDPKAIEEGLKSGMVKKYDSIEALADGMGINKDALVKEINAYNDAIAKGTSPGFGLDAKKAKPIKEGPFYVSKAVVRTFGTITSIKINSKTEVLDSKGNAVKNLYSAGETTVGNAFSRMYPGVGIGISYAANTGRLAAKAAADSLK